MQLRALGALAVTAALAFGVAACGSDDTPSTSGGGGDATSTPAAKAKVGVILPDAASSARWETADRKYLGEAFAAAGVDSDIQNANGDKAKFATIADQMLNERRQRPADRQPRLAVGGGGHRQGQAAGRAGHRLRPPHARRWRPVLRVLRQRRGRHEDRRRPREVHAGQRQVQRPGGAAQRLADRQQRHAVQAGLREGDHRRGLLRRRRSERARLGQHQGRHDLRADVHEGQGQFRGRRERQ